jgi:flagellar basal-body rod protein FlgB
MGDFLNSLATRLVGRAMDLRQMRQKLIASNIANVHTPEYHSKDIKFEDQLRKAAETPKGRILTTHANHMGGMRNVLAVQPEIVSPDSDIVKNDLNSVDLETEMMKLNENNVMYDTLVTVLRKKFEVLDYAIREGGK